MDMDTKFYLSQIDRFEKQIQNKLIEAQQLKTLVCSTTISNEKERVQTSGNKDQLGSIVTKIVGMEQEAEEMMKKRCEIVRQIESLENPDFYNILANLYILKKELKVIAIELGKSYGYAKKLHRDALKEFEEKYGKMYLCP